MLIQPLVIASPKSVCRSELRWRRALDVANELCARDGVPGLSFQIQRNGQATPVQYFGSSSLTSQRDLCAETRFLVASLTKPVLAMGVLKLVEQGRLGLNQRVSEILPECQQPAKRLMTVRHLLSHTSGLPDMLPENQELRRNHAPQSTFVAGALQVELQSPVGRAAQYQSMGYAILGEIIQRVTHLSCSEFLQKEIFELLNMRHTSLGVPVNEQPALIFADIDVPPEQSGQTHWNWNSPYWRSLGATWGGLVSTSADLSQFLWELMKSDSLWSPQSIELATTNRLNDFPGISEVDRRTKPWGLGWRLNWPEHKHALCELMPPETCGHWGATGTLFWLHRPSQTAVVILSSLPVLEKSSPLSRLSNALAAALI